LLALAGFRDQQTDANEEQSWRAEHLYAGENRDQIHTLGSRFRPTLPRKTNPSSAISKPFLYRRSKMATATVTGTTIGAALDASIDRIAAIATNAAGLTPGQQMAALVTEANVLAAVKAAFDEAKEGVKEMKN
jgi:hypothetical protein